MTTRQGLSYAVVEQIRTVDKARIGKVVGKIKKAEQEKLVEVIKNTYVD